MTKEENSATAKQVEGITEPMNELSEDMELISPGSMLKEAREKLSLSQEEIAKKLNFRPSLVANMEQDIFDATLPATFNRGYLVSYAKLVAIDVEDILASYDVLGAANIQRSEMQSFSKQTVKEAEHSRVMWLSYLILIVLVGLTALWWQQDNKQSAALLIEPSTAKPALTENETPVETSVTDSSLADTVAEEVAEKTSSATETMIDEVGADLNKEAASVIAAPIIENTEQIIPAKPQENLATETLQEEQKPIESPSVAHAVFTFSGDCWVNIYDATGERIAWGIKKSGYVMDIKGVAPLRITLGKPELASIIFNDEPVDMSTFNRGNIAKFTLPLSP